MHILVLPVSERGGSVDEFADSKDTAGAAHCTVSGDRMRAGTCVYMKARVCMRVLVLMSAGLSVCECVCVCAFVRQPDNKTPEAN